MLQPAGTTNETLILQSDNVAQYSAKDTGSESEQEIWSFDRAINEVFRLLPQELCSEQTKEQSPAKPLSGIEHLMESHELHYLCSHNQSWWKIQFILNKLNSEKCGKDWLCSQNLVASLAPTKFYKSQNQFPTDNIPQLEAEFSLLDLSNKGRCSVPAKNLEVWEKRACKLVAINSHADLFSSAAYFCLQKEPMSGTTLSRLLEAVAKSIKHATAMSTILATELFQARLDAALATSKLLLENSCYKECSN